MSRLHSGDREAVRLLSLDGGGIRGLSSLIILKHLMEQVNPQNPPKPCDYFQLIGGTSTGGLIAIMLGRLRMGVDECIGKYLDLSAEAFRLKRSKLDLLARGRDLWKADGKYRSECLAQEFRNAAMQAEDDPHALLLDADSNCRVFVCANSKNPNQPVVIRSYKTDTSVNSLSTAIGNVQIWEAARATSAASTFFDPIQIGTQWYVDGATGMNNPVDIVLAEAKAIWPEVARERIQCLVSIGTGVPTLKNFGDNLLQIKDTLKALSTETERTEERFYRNHAELGVGGRYFRFNVDNGLSDVALDEQDKKDRIVAATELYLEKGRVRGLVAAFLKAKPPQNASVSALMKNRYLEWLPYTDTRQHHNEARNHRESDETGNWFLSGPFRQWKSELGSFMWLHAKAGSGKTVLCSTIIDQLEEGNRAHVAFFYLSFQRSDSELVDLWHFKCSLLVQILKATIKPDPLDPTLFLVPSAFKRLYSKYQPSTRPKMEDLDATFWEILALSRTTYLVIDGLDEYPRTGRRDIMAFLGEIASRFQSSAHVMVTSRDEPDIDAAVGEVPAPQLVVAFDNDTINDDIRRHLDVLLERDPSYGSWSMELKEEVVNQLTSQADGVFQWADLQIRTLAGKEREKDIKKALKKLPRGLEKTYERMLRRIEDADQSDEAILILSWLLCAKRSLSLSEVAELAAFEVTARDSDGSSDDDTSSNGDGDTLAASTTGKGQGLPVTFDPTARFSDHDSIRRILVGLVSFSEVSEFNLWDESDPPATRTIVAFAHFSVKQYLQSQNVCPSNFHLEPHYCDRLVFECCLAYMEHYDTRSQETRNQAEDRLEGPHPPYPLLLYAWQHTWSHALAGYVSHGAATRRRHKAEDTIRPFGLLTRQRTRERGPSFMLSVRHATWTATFRGLEGYKPVPSLIEGYVSDLAGITADLQDPSSIWASVFTCLARLKRADRSVAHAIAASADPTSIQILLDIGINVEMTNPHSSYSGLIHALASGELCLSEYWSSLRDRCYYVFDRARDRPPIHEALQLLLDAGCAVDALDSNGLTPLHWAASAGEASSLRCLVKHYKIQQNEDTILDVNRQDLSGKSPFFVAFTAGHLDAAKTLLEVPTCNINLTDSRQRTPLIEAACRGRRDMVEFLLSRPEVEINGRDILGRTALFWAVWRGHISTVNMLFACPGVETSPADSEGWSLLICAAERGHDEIVHIMLRRPELDINLSDIQGRTAISWAAFRGHKAIVEMILQHRHVKANIKDRLGFSAFDWAVFRANKTAVEFLARYHGNNAVISVYEQALPFEFQCMTSTSTVSPLDLKMKGEISFPDGRQSDEVWHTAFSNDGRRLAISGRSGFVNIWDLNRHMVISTLHPPVSPLDHVTAAVWSPDDSMIVTCSEYAAFLWDVESGTVLRNVHIAICTNSCIWSPDCKWFIVGCYSSFGSFFRQESVEPEDYGTGSNLRAWFETIKHPVRDVVISPNGKILIATDEDGFIQVYNITTQTLEKSKKMGSMTSSIALSKDAKHLLVFCNPGDLQLLDLATLEVVSRYAGAAIDKYRIRCGFGGGIRGERFVLCGSEDGSVLIWNRETTELLARLPSAHPPSCNAVAWSPVDPGLFVSGGDDHTCKI